MERNDNSHKYSTLRNTYKQFIYESYEIKTNADAIEIGFHYSLDGKYHFNPTLSIPLKSFIHPEIIKEPVFENIVFHIGMIELVSYWKAACPSEIIVKPFILDEDQKNWWKKIYFHGLGEFFYLNSINPEIIDFVTISCDSKNVTKRQNVVVADEALIPIGGGKDSAVTVDYLKSLLLNNLCFILNPRKATLDTAYTAGYNEDSVFVINRKLDPLLLKMNEEGFLNGHTPFSALLAFVSVMAAMLSQKKYIALSNESSANESTVSDSTVNHQYSKSFEFEQDYRNYLEKYITPDIQYFSFLRPVSELQIGKMFSALPKYHSVFRSCNAGSKTDTWCCSCSKCLFTYIILSPFLSRAEMLSIFGKDLFDDPDLMFEFKQLVGIAETKPFECVGTVTEVNAALIMIISKYNSEKLPYLLEFYKTLPENNKGSDIDTYALLHEVEDQHFLEDRFLKIINDHLNDKDN
jgi:UDP-N-acetyl-alpha-D-muramoyl-L-alanyl-L-glutamate epimerase